MNLRTSVIILCSCFIIEKESMNSFAISNRKTYQSLRKWLIKKRIILIWNRFNIFYSLFIIVDFVQSNPRIVSNEKIDIVSAIDPSKNCLFFEFLFNSELRFLSDKMSHSMAIMCDKDQNIFVRIVNQLDYRVLFAQVSHTSLLPRHNVDQRVIIDEYSFWPYIVKVFSIFC